VKKKTKEKRNCDLGTAGSRGTGIPSSVGKKKKIVETKSQRLADLRPRDYKNSGSAKFRTIRGDWTSTEQKKSTAKRFISSKRDSAKHLQQQNPPRNKQVEYLQL